MNLKYQVETKVDLSNDLIVQDVLVNDLWDREGKMKVLYTNVLRMQDEGIRDALIKLGWTPPPDKPEEKMD